METITLILGVVAIALSIFAIIASWILYNKSDSLNKEVRDFVIEIRTVTGKMYSDSFGLVKKSYERFISHGIGETRAFMDDKFVREIIEDVSNKVEGKLLQEFERLKTGEKDADGKIDKLRTEIEDTIKEIPVLVDELKKARLHTIKIDIIDVVKNNKGISPGELIDFELLDGKYGKNFIMDALIELIDERYIVGEKGIGQNVGFDEPMKVTGKRLLDEKGS